MIWSSFLPGKYSYKNRYLKVFGKILFKKMLSGFYIFGYAKISNGRAKPSDPRRI